MPTTVTLNFPASGTLTAKALYTSSEPGPEYSVWYYATTKQIGTSTKVSTNNLVLPQGCQVYKVIPSGRNENIGALIDNGGISVTRSNGVAVANYFTSLAASGAYNSTITLVYRYSGAPWAARVYEEVEQDRYFAQITRTKTATHNAFSLAITYYTAEEIEQGIVPGDDILPDEADGNISFIIEPYGSNRQRYGVAIGGAPTSQSDTVPSFDCYIPTTFSSGTTMNLTNEKFIYQIPLWNEVPYTDFQNNYYPNDTWPVEYCCMNGSVYIKGFVHNSSATWTTNKVIFTLPEGYRPTYAVQKECFLRTYTLRGSKKGYCVVTVNTNGTVVYSYPVALSGTSSITNTDYSANDAFICLDMGFRL